MTKAQWGILEATVHYYRSDTFCVKCRLLLISPLASAQHVSPNGATSITAMTTPYLSVRLIIFIWGCTILMMPKGGEQLHQIQITVS